MAGWTCPDKNDIYWNGRIISDRFKGDGSELTGISGVGGGTELWASAANLIHPIDGTQAVSAAGLVTAGVVSGATLDATGNVSGAYIYGDGSNLTGMAAGSDTVLWASAANLIQPKAGSQAISGAGFVTAGIVSGASIFSGAAAVLMTEVDPLFSTQSGAFLTTEVDPLFSTQSGAFLTSETDPLFSVQSGAFADNTSYQITSAAEIITTAGLVEASAALHTKDNATSAALTTHTGDTSDPHGANLTQTYVSLTSGAVTGDSEQCSQAYLANIVYGTGATPPTASNFARGTIYLQYTA